MKIIDGVYQIKVPLPSESTSDLGFTLTYLIEDQDGWGLVDTGWNDEKSFSAFQQQLEEFKLNFTDIAWIFVTHSHSDHIGLVDRIKELSGAKLIMSRPDAPAAIRELISSFGTDIQERLRVWYLRNGVPLEELPDQTNKPGRYLPKVDADHVVEVGEAKVEVSPSLFTIWTPGHSPGHLCLLDTRRKLLFSGDHVLPGITPHVSLFPFITGDPLADYLSSLKKIEGLEVDQVLPAHEYQFKNLRQRLSQILNHHDERLDELLDTVKEKPKSAYEIASLITWNLNDWDKMASTDRIMALFETNAHVEYLVNQGQLGRDEENGQVLYHISR